MAFKCPFCQHEGMPTTEARISTGGWILFAVLLIMCFPICWIPFVVAGCKEEVRRCAACGTKVGIA